MCDFRELFWKILPAVHIVFIIVWLSNLAATDAYFSVYGIVAFLSFYLTVRPEKNSTGFDGSGRAVICLLSGIFSAIVLLANYPLFTTIGDPALIGRSTSIMVNLINGILTFIGGIYVAYPILVIFFSHFPTSSCGRFQRNSRWLPFAIFGSIVIINLIHLFFVEYPGNLTEDTFTQISEMISGEFSNFNTFWHTMIFRSVLMLGDSFFSDANTAIALFTVVQMMVVAFAFTHCLMTMILYGVPKWAVIVSYLIFAIIPYNMALSITIWKDVLFAAGCLLMLSAWVRILIKIGSKPIWNYVVFLFGSVLFLVSRTNGWIIYLVSFILYVSLIRKDKRFLALMGATAALGWFLLNPALSMLNVDGGDLAESLSIPIQQVSRVIAEGRDLTEGEEALLSRVVDLDEVPDLYTNWISDPMKVEVRSKDYAYFQQNLGEYTSLWLKLGLRYPTEYVKAWVDQTKGYWNAGYDYAMYSETVTDNPYGVEKMTGGNPIASLFRLYFGLSRHVIFFEPLHSIGLHVWIVILCFLLNVIRKRELWIISMPVLLLVVGLWFGTPVYSCFRYVYPLFVSFPLIVSTSLWQPSE